MSTATLSSLTLLMLEIPNRLTGSLIRGVSILTIILDSEKEVLTIMVLFFDLLKFKRTKIRGFTTSGHRNDVHVFA